MAKSDKWKAWFQENGEMTPDGQALVLGWARRGLIDEQIASNMGVSLSTLKNWKRKYKSFSSALRVGKDVSDFLVENALFKKALGGDTTAMIFWLKNRLPAEYRDKHDIEQSGNVNFTYDSVVLLDLPAEDDDKFDAEDESDESENQP